MLLSGGFWGIEMNFWWVNHKQTFRHEFKGATAHATTGSACDWHQGR
jgi:hypothetical protein